MSKRKNESIMRKIALEEMGVSRSSPEYKAVWAKIDRRIEKLPEELYSEIDSYIENARKEMRMLARYSM